MLGLHGKRLRIRFVNAALRSRTYLYLLLLLLFLLALLLRIELVGIR
jgi:hypothetical protein